jgi:hypothetical protein
MVVPLGQADRRGVSSLTDSISLCPGESLMGRLDDEPQAELLGMLLKASLPETRDGVKPGTWWVGLMSLHERRRSPDGYRPCRTCPRITRRQITRSRNQALTPVRPSGTAWRVTNGSVSRLQKLWIA